MKKNIQIIIDVSMSMKDTIGLVYVYLHQFFSHVQERGENLEVSYQLTWFSGEEYRCVEFKPGRTWTNNHERLMGELKQLKLRRGKSNETVIKEALLSSLNGSNGEECNQVVFYFSDYYLNDVMYLTEAKGVNRVFLFVPETQGSRYRFKIVNSENRVQKLMPALEWNLEDFKNELSKEDLECFYRLAVGYSEGGE